MKAILLLLAVLVVWLALAGASLVLFLWCAAKNERRYSAFDSGTADLVRGHPADGTLTNSKG